MPSTNGSFTEVFDPSKYNVITGVLDVPTGSFDELISDKNFFETAQPSALESYVLDLINATRANVGAPALHFDDELMIAADNHNSWLDQTDNPELVKENGNPHAGENGSQPADRIKAAGYDYTGTGENIWVWYGTGVEATKGYMDQAHHWFLTHDPAYQNLHYKAIVNPNFEEVGISVQQGDYQGQPAVFLTEDFGTPTPTERAEDLTIDYGLSIL